ncbi:MAG: NYN domain-containing protein [Pseudomonadota bacterium]
MAWGQSAEARPPLLAVLIDADNTSPRVADAVFKEIATLGEASVRRLYGDFSTGQLRAWEKKLAPLAIVPFWQPANTVGKNSSDIALVIDAMDLVHSGRFDGFCLVSSDSDFTRLASRIREQGLDVYGFGERKTPEAFRQACKRFFYVENLGDVEGEKAPGTKAKTEKPSAVAPLVRAAMEACDDDDGWVRLGPLGQQLQATHPDFDPRTFGSRKLSDLLEKAGFEVDTATRPARMRLKPKTRSRGKG